jgi:SAM-dependent methyltransferase
MKLRLERKFSSFWDEIQRFTLKRLVRSYEPYHPVVLGETTIAQGERSCVDRWTLIENTISGLHPATFLDLGCAEGYFVQQAAKTFKCVAIGVDADIRRLTVARTASSLNQTKGAGFIDATIDLPLLAKLPAFEVVIFLSVMHHIMYEHGVEYSREILRSLRALTTKALVFDMGQSNEISHEWARLLPKMEPNPEAWISQLLLSAGFSKVDVIGNTDAYKNEVRRSVFIARP